MLIIFQAISSPQTGTANQASDLGDSSRPHNPAIQDATDTIQDLVMQAIAEEEDVLAYLIYDTRVDVVQISQDGSWALAWLSFLDPETGTPVPTEPGLAFARKDAGAWRIFLQSDPAWLDTLDRLPADLLPHDARQEWVDGHEAHLAESQLGPFTGYYLPWAAGTSIYLTRSISHGVGGSMHYAFDFAKPGYPSGMFAIYASKGGFVKYAVWHYPNGYFDGVCSHSNYLVLEDPTTTPTTYALYLHLAQDSIPEPFRQRGTYVNRGQFIGLADDTGCSTGNHLHFMLHTNPNSYWGTSVDITFLDVPINGGRPRTPPEANNYPQHGSQGQYLYTSANPISTDNRSPTGGLNLPITGEVVSSNSLEIDGWAWDKQSGINQIQIVARYNDIWQNVGPAHTTSPFSFDWDLCSDSVPDGPLSVALNIWDNDGNLAYLEGSRHVLVKAGCPSPPPPCTPTDNQVALFSKANFQGSCVVLGAGEVPDGSNLGPLGDNSAESIQVGARVQATLFSGALFSERRETFFTPDSNLADNLVGANSLSSVRVRGRDAVPGVPMPVDPPDGEMISQFESVSLIWQDAMGAAEYQVNITGPAGMVTSGWQSAAHWIDPGSSLGGMPVGEYIWQVRARNHAGVTAWSPARTFTIQHANPGQTSPFTAPYFEDMESADNDWISSGLWHQADASLPAHSGSHSWWYGDDSSRSYDTGDIHAGTFTSPNISIPATGYGLRFWYRYQTESPEYHWDQRLIQLSVNDGPFFTIGQLFDDVANYWLRSPTYDLSAYSGQTVRIRFRFETLDAGANNKLGWLIDDVEISPFTPASCSDLHEPNDFPGTAIPITYGSLVSGLICPAGDIDFFTFQASAGDRVAIDIDAESLGSPLDSHIFLYDSDGRSLLASHDDEIPYSVRDSHLGFRVPRDGQYYLKVRAWNHPGVGDEGYFYNLVIVKDGIPPTASQLNPVSRSYLPQESVPITLSASDSESGIDRVSFAWHSGDWAGSNWIIFSQDRDSEDGWNATFATDGLQDQSGIGLHARVFDWAGNWTDLVSWELVLDRKAPETALQILPPVQRSTAFPLTWTAVDHVSGLERFDIQVKIDNGPWQDFLTALDPTARSAWFIGEPNHLYAFRMRGADLAGNLEPYPSTEETLTFVTPCSSPDPWEPDDNPAKASPILADGVGQSHNFCNMSQTADEDWFTFNAQAGRNYRILTVPTHASSATVISLFDMDGLTPLRETLPFAFGRPATLEWEAHRSGNFFLRIRHLDDRVVGDEVGYIVWILEGYGAYAPLIRR